VREHPVGNVRRSIAGDLGHGEFRGLRTRSYLRFSSDLAERMVKAADAALYESKRAGRNRVTAGCIADTEERSV